MENTGQNYQVVFSGAIQRGQNIDEVKRAIAAALRLTVEKTDKLFSGRKLVLKRTTTLDQAEAFVRVFANAGALASVEGANGKPLAPTASAQNGAVAPSTALPLPPFYPFPANWLFKPALFVAAAFESLLTLLYVVLLAGAVLLLVYHALDASWLSELIQEKALATVLSGLLLLGGTVLTLLLAKPLLGLFHRKEPVFELVQEAEPEFFRYLEEVAALVGVRLPSKILVNNGAALAVRPVWSWSGLRRGERQMTVGLVLLAGLNSRQFAALLAQALHPWRPGFAPLVGRLLTGNMQWLQRAGYRSDLLDRKLRDWQLRSPGAAPLLRKLAAFAAWSAKPAIWRLTFSRFLSRRLLHRLIADSDACARQVAGNGELRLAMEQSRLLTFAEQHTLPELQKRWKEKGELPDNIATAVVARARHYPAQIQGQLAAMQERRLVEQGAFLPSDAQRLAFANAAEESGQYDINVPCAAFFLRLEKLMHIMTIRYYHAFLHIPVTTNKLVRVAVRGSLEYEADQRIARYFGDSYADFVPLRLAVQHRGLPGTVRELVQKWRVATAQIAAEQARTANLAFALHGADDDLIDISNHELLERAGVGSALTGLAMLRGKREELQQQCRDSEAVYEAALEEHQKALAAFAQRLLCALALLNTAEVQQRMFDSDKLHQEITQLLAAHEKIETNYPKLRELRLHVILLESLLSYEAMKSTPKLRDRISELSHDIRTILAAFGLYYKTVPFPLLSEEHYVNLLDWVQAQSASGEGAPADYDRGNDMARRMALMQRLIMGRLVTVALHVESVLGLKAGATP